MLGLRTSARARPPAAAGRRRAGPVPRPEAGQVDLAQPLLDPGRERRSPQPAEAQPVRDVLEHGHVGPEGVVLEDHPDVAGVRRKVGDVPIPEPDATRVQTVEPGDETEQRRLAASRGAEQREQLAVRDLERDVSTARTAPNRLLSSWTVMFMWLRAGPTPRGPAGRDSRLLRGSGAGTLFRIGGSARRYARMRECPLPRAPGHSVGRHRRHRPPPRRAP